MQWIMGTHIKPILDEWKKLVKIKPLANSFQGSQETNISGQRGMILTLQLSGLFVGSIKLKGTFPYTIKGLPEAFNAYQRYLKEKLH